MLVIRKSAAVQVMLMFVMLVSTKATATAISGYHRQDQADDPVFKDYRGVTIGMTASETRQKLGKPKITDKAQDLFVLEENESAQIFYDDQEKVYAISVDFTGRNSDAPTPRDVLGEDLTARADGSMYRMKQFSDEGYWVSYNRTSADPPQVTVTMQKISNKK